MPHKTFVEPLITSFQGKSGLTKIFTIVWHGMVPCKRAKKPVFFAWCYSFLWKDTTTSKLLLPKPGPAAIASTTPIWKGEDRDRQGCLVTTSEEADLRVLLVPQPERRYLLPHPVHWLGSRPGVPWTTSEGHCLQGTSRSNQGTRDVILEIKYFYSTLCNADFENIQSFQIQ